MKTLLVLRHAKSDWNDHHLSDHDRTLNERGQKDAPRMGKLLHKEGLTPDQILSSTAVRARETAKAVAQASQFGGDIDLFPELYHDGMNAYIAALSHLSAPIERALIVGHNPSVEELVHSLTGRPVGMPTATLVQIELPIDEWMELTGETAGKLIQSWQPKDLK